MDSKAVVIPVTLKGVNYLLWSRMIKTALGGRGLWSHITTSGAPSQTIQQEAGTEIAPFNEDRWLQEDLMVLSIIQNSLEASILEAYSYCETAKDIWDTLKTVYGNTSNLSRVFEVKKAINNLSQEEMEFTQHFGKFRSLWAELEMLRPSTIDPATIIERREQDKVFGLLLTLNPTYNDLIKHILRAEKLPTLEEVCAQIQKEQGSHGLFGGKGELPMANKAETIRANKVGYKPAERKVFTCEFCKKKGHMKDKCWILHPHLKPNKFKDASAHLSNGEEGQALTAFKSTEDGMIRKSDLDELIKALKENYGNTLGKSFIASNISKSLIIDSGASHHMISNSKLINDVEPAPILV